MMANPFYLISFLLSALIAFAVMVVMVESFFVLFKIKQGRVRSILRFFPFVSLVLDLFLNNFSMGYWLNPLNCRSCVQKFLLSIFFPELKSYLYSNEISLVNYLGSENSHIIFSYAFVIFVMIVLYFTLYPLFAAFISAKELKKRMKHEEVCQRPIENALLAAAVLNNKIKVFASATITVPFATYSKAIFIPKNIVETYPQEEFEAIIAHELEHILWKDPIIRLLSQLVAAIFWWVPTSLWQKKLALDQEIACDQSILKYKLREEHLAAALIKIAAINKGKPCSALCYLSDEKHPSLWRLQAMLTPAVPYYKGFSYSIVILGLMIGLGCLLWL